MSRAWWRIMLDKILASHRGGYESRPEFIKEAVRKRLEEIKALAK
jgi:metal-responsive CopG/Arc/MetJ family transcriptional regulator